MKSCRPRSTPSPDEVYRERVVVSETWCTLVGAGARESDPQSAVWLAQAQLQLDHLHGLAHQLVNQLGAAVGGVGLEHPL